ncbi:MAG: hypothetical protein WC518_02730 [Patescibacteria group bacterium]
MALSSLQKYVLRQGLESKKRAVSKTVLNNFYLSQKQPPKKIDQENVITKSVERLIGRGLIKGVGIKTAQKWFIKEVILTPAGLRTAKKLLGEQQALPLKNKLKNNK